jgi:transcriptional regulator with XRE-family HTH domain
VTRLPLHVGFGRAVRRIRSERDLSQEGLGFRAGMHRNYVGRVERAEGAATLRTVEALADALEISASDLIAQSETYAACGER